MRPTWELTATGVPMQSWSESHRLFTLRIESPGYRENAAGTDALFISERDERIHAHGATRGQVAGEARDQG